MATVTQADPRRWWALAALVPVALALNIDATVLSLAIPTLSGALHASTAELQWFVAGYTLVFAATMVPGGMLGDRYGRKKLLLAALVLFGIASAACAWPCASTPWRNAARSGRPHLRPSCSRPSLSGSSTTGA